MLLEAIARAPILRLKFKTQCSAEIEARYGLSGISDDLKRQRVKSLLDGMALKYIYPGDIEVSSLSINLSIT